MRIERLREVVDREGRRERGAGRRAPRPADPAELEQQGREAGLRVLAPGAIPQTDEYVGSTVVMLGG